LSYRVGSFGWSPPGFLARGTPPDSFSTTGNSRSGLFPGIGTLLCSCAEFIPNLKEPSASLFTASVNFLISRVRSLADCVQQFFLPSLRLLSPIKHFVILEIFFPGIRDPVGLHAPRPTISSPPRTFLSTPGSPCVLSLQHHYGHPENPLITISSLIQGVWVRDISS